MKVSSLTPELLGTKQSDFQKHREHVYLRA